MHETNPEQGMFELFQKMLNPMAFPMQHLLMPSLSVEEVDRKISDLRAVESWLKTSLSMVELSIKGLEYQRALLDPGTKDKKTEAAQNPFLDPKLWPWNFLQPQDEGAKPDPPKKKRAKRQG